VWDYFDDTVHSPDDFARRGITIAFLGPIPLIKAIEAPEEERFLITHYQPRSSAAESFRYLRVAINFSAPAESLKNLVFTSSLSGEGKSFIAHNIAISLAQDGNRTLLIDSDLRKPVAQRVYKMENQAGLSNFLTSEIEFDTLVRQTFIENLSVVLSGPASPNPAEILASKRMVSFLQSAKERFDRVIIDAPPLIGMGDSLILGSLTSHVVFVIRAAKTPAEIIRKSKDVLERTGIRIIGAILNSVDIEKERHGGYYKYYYQSYGRYYTSSDAEKKPR
jgi:capsular exopolysaccharide synthesis family protein